VLDLQDPEIAIEGTLMHLLDTPAWNLQISSGAVSLPWRAEPPAVTFRELSANLAGEWPKFELDLSAELESEWLEPARVSLAGEGTLDGFAFRQLSLESRELSMTSAGTLDWAESLRLDLEAAIDRLEPGRWLPEWPEDRPAAGVLSLQWNADSLTIDAFEMAVAQTSLVASGSGVIDTRHEVVDLTVRWRDFNWPLDAVNPVVASESGRLRVAGRPDDWALHGGFDLESVPFPRGRIELDGTGDEESLAIALREAQILGGVVSGTLSWRWTGSQPFNAELEARQVDITTLVPAWPGVIDVRFGVRGEVDPLRVAGMLHELDGTVLGLPVSGRGGFHFEEGKVFADDLFLATGSSSLSLDGSLYEPGGVRFSADIDSLARFSDDLAGSLAADGNLSLHAGAPRISMTLSGDQLSLGSVAVNHIETIDDAGAGPVIGLELSGLLIGQRPVEKLTLRFDGERPLEWLDVQARTEDTDIHMELNGALDDWNEPFSSGWTGVLSRLDIDHQGGFKLGLDQEAGLRLTTLRFTLEPACLSGTHDAHLCVASDWRAPDELVIKADLAAIPAGLIDLFAHTDLAFTQILSGRLDWTQTAAAGQNAVAEFSITPGTIRAEEDDEVLLETGPGLFRFDLADGEIRNGQLNLNIPGTGDIDVDFNVPDLALGRQSPVQGHLRVDFRDLSPLGEVLPLLDTINGAIDLDLAVSGLVGDPRFSGRVSIRNGQMTNHASGFSFTDINLSGAVTEQDRAEMSGTFRAGEGSGNVRASILFEDALSPVVRLALQGQSLTLIDVPDLSVIADPDVELGFRNQTLEIDGRLLIPRARLTPSYLPQSSVRQSEDVVVVAGELAVPEEDFNQDNPVKIRGTLEVELGNEAAIELEFARVKVSGSTRFTWLDDVVPGAKGNFDIRGDIQAYGQNLKVTQGRVSFPDIPADNPILNIRAEREIYGNSQIQKAGLMVAGTAKRPIIEPYTVPATNKDRARTLLVTGSDFNYEQGVGAVAVGTYVLPKLYVSYGIGVFEEGSVISARYDLSKRFGVKVTSGQKDTGVDLNYTLER
jgi:translocation and assembly module TamB